MFAASRTAVARVAARPSAAAANVVGRTATGVGAQVRAMSGATQGTNSPANAFYRLVFKRNATYVAFILAGAMIGGSIYNSVMDGVFTAYNKGVR